MKISDSVLGRIEARIKKMCNEHQQEMETAFLKSSEDPLDIKFGVKITPDSAKVKLTTSMNFVKDRCKDTVTEWVDDEQGSLFDQEGGADAL